MYLLNEFKGKKGRSGRKKGNFITGDPTNKRNRKIGRAIGTGLGIATGILTAKKTKASLLGTTALATVAGIGGNQIGDTIANRKLNTKEKIGNILTAKSSSYKFGGKKANRNSDNSLKDNIKEGAKLTKKLISLRG